MLSFIRCGGRGSKGSTALRDDDEEGGEIGNPAATAASSTEAGWRKKGSSKNAKETVDPDTKIIHKYQFTCGDRRRELSLAHVNACWYIKMDSELLLTKAHSSVSIRRLKESSEFEIPVGEFEIPVMAKMTMEWFPFSLKWQYTLLLGDTVIPPCWSKKPGSTGSPVVAPEAPEGPLAAPEAPEGSLAVPEVRPRSETEESFICSV